jgi:hypothetical protein
MDNKKMNQGAVVIASCAPKGVRRRPRCRGYEGVITKVDGEFVTVRFGNGSMRKYHKSNLSLMFR